MGTTNQVRLSCFAPVVKRLYHVQIFTGHYNLPETSATAAPMWLPIPNAEIQGGKDDIFTAPVDQLRTAQE